jgi:hypothetical protein
MKFSKEERKDIAGKLMDLGNLILAAVTFGQAFSAQSGKGLIAVAGFGIFLGLYAFALFIRKRR